MKVLPFFFCFLLCLSCCPAPPPFEPRIEHLPHPASIECMPTAFPPLSPAECAQSWGKELYLATAFVRRDFDLYRAITCYKRAYYLLPPALTERQMQIEYGILQSYYLGKKYQQVIETFESSKLREATLSFPAYQDLLITLYDSYNRLGADSSAQNILEHLWQVDSDLGSRMELSEAVRSADFTTLAVKAGECIDPSPALLLQTYQREAKSVEKARLYNALLPGAGYLYVGQRQTAFNAFILNALFIGAAYYFFDHGNVAAGLITSSFELGWYLGGINGAGLAAQEYNERLYENAGRNFLLKHKLFPILSWQYGF